MWLMKDTCDLGHAQLRFLGIFIFIWETSCSLNILTFVFSLQENKATNTDHLTTVLYLQFTICSSLQNLEKTIFCLQKLISLHPFNPWNWGKLGEAYLNLGPALSASLASSQKENSFTSSDTAIKSSFPHSGKDCLLCFPETLPESSVEVSSGNKQKSEKALKNIQNHMTEERAAVLLETEMKACASFIRTR